VSLFYEIVVAGNGLYDQPAGSTEFPIASLAGVGGYVEKRGVGRLRSEEYTILSGGGFSVSAVTSAGDVFFFIPNFFTDEIVSGSYTNGFNYPKVMAAVASRIGWKDQGGQVDSFNQVSRSGRYFNDGSFHPLVTLQNIKANMENPAASGSEFNAELQQIARGSIISSLAAVFNQSEHVEDVLLFERGLNNDRPIDNAGKFVGVGFKVAKGYALQVKRIQLYFTEQVSFNLYLYHDTQNLPVWQQEVEVSAGETIQVELSSALILNYLTPDYSGGNFYLGYYQDTLGSAKAIDEQGCKTKRIAFGSDFIQADKLGASFNKRQVSVSMQTFGINAEVATFKDHTDYIISQSHLFDNAIGLQVAYSVAKMIMYSTRSNKTQRTTGAELDKTGLQYELDGALPVPYSPKTTGLQQKINSELKRIRESFFPRQKSQIVNLC
jgi:hypothetical protein